MCVFIPIQKVHFNWLEGDQSLIPQTSEAGFLDNFPIVGTTQEGKLKAYQRIAPQCSNYQGFGRYAVTANTTFWSQMDHPQKKILEPSTKFCFSLHGIWAISNKVWTELM